MRPAALPRRGAPRGRGVALLALSALVAGLAPGCQRRRPDPGASPTAGGPEDQAPRTPARPMRRGPSRPAPPLPACGSDLAAAIRATRAAAPSRGSDTYRPPSGAVVKRLGAAIQAALGATPGAAADHARAAGYHACRRGDLVLLLPGPGHALVALRTRAARPLVVSVPHPLHEPGTDAEGRLAFEKWRALALVVAGAHRCASRAPSPCAGRTKVCGGGRQPFRHSDAGHATGSQFHGAHVALLAHRPGLTVVSLHGMQGDGVSLSDGTRQAVATTSRLAAAARALAKVLPGERVTTCQAGAGVEQAERYCGRTNVQGRLVNGSPQPCRRRARQSSGRFLHLEQSKALRQRPAAIVNALAPALP